MPEDSRPRPSGRRRHLLAMGLGGAGLMAASRMATAQTPATPLPLTAQTTEGPFYFDAGKVRQDITEGQPGVPVEVRFTVVDMHGRPLAGRRVDLWHCNASGVYSGYAGQVDDHGQRVSMRDRTFLRGSQPVGADGVAVFRTIYPGWYAGRATHLHMKVIDGSRTLLTTQCFLPDALSEYLYTQLPTYRRKGVREVLNRNDGIALMAGDTVLGAVREARDRYVIALTLVVDPTATAPREPGHPPGPPPGAPGGFGKSMVPAEGMARVEAIVPGQHLQK
ncbi:protocatechuate 3,4-dioxygenase beta subunit [Cupriavidus metallidurans]|jgi:protocatechuate 3,4-dioxygenase beta subunit|uniref:intradiol ring-cleavage dioxygenase n=1 Tax=Cupriavidus TaxID=106589 RepID=UPI00049380F1|nr:intradiol ring-cleavage dioxygenase [Cupriavidus metallidurans]AVA35747.1 intradiol ring-cleavage dioxygenase [Cupriavidus metallidurans]KWW35597.1 Catechol 1,2-dioxygenase 1 [Cupriavidus metallidurans]MDE4921737.1 intradiol ring-cleavage dioxygenase [Cupriavidus metallidurans]